MHQPQRQQLTKEMVGIHCVTTASRLLILMRMQQAYCMVAIRLFKQAIAEGSRVGLRKMLEDVRASPSNAERDSLIGPGSHHVLIS